ncbi:DedA family protein [Acetobacteraceae bacterium]|nr:DedA family protein [Acetobacteraceae bacterium]
MTLKLVLRRNILHLHLPNLSALLQPYFENYGYLVVGIIIFLESIGLPLPAETLVIAISLYAAITHSLNIFIIALLTILATIFGNIIGYFIGKKIGHVVLKNFGKYIGLNEDRLLIGRYLCHHWGGITIVFSRYFALLRLVASLIAGALHMNLRRFLIADIIGGVLWGLTYTLGTYYFGEHLLKLPVFEIILIVTIIIIGFGISFFFLKREEKTLLRKARIFFRYQILKDSFSKN